MGKATDLYLDAYRIMIVPTSYSPETNRLFDWTLEGGAQTRIYTWFSWNKSDINKRMRSSLGFVNGSPSPFPVPTSNTVPGGVLSNFTLSLTDPLINEFQGDLYCLLKVQSSSKSEILPAVQGLGSFTQGSGSHLYSDTATVYMRGNRKKYANTFRTSFDATEFGNQDDVGQILFKFAGIAINQTQPNLDAAGSFVLDLRC